MWHLVFVDKRLFDLGTIHFALEATQLLLQALFYEVVKRLSSKFCKEKRGEGNRKTIIILGFFSLLHCLINDHLFKFVRDYFH